MKEKWGKLTDDDLAEINGKREQLASKIQKRYGLARDRVEQELALFEKNYNEQCKCKEHAGQERGSQFSPKHQEKGSQFPPKQSAKR